MANNQVSEVFHLTHYQIVAGVYFHVDATADPCWGSFRNGPASLSVLLKYRGVYELLLHLTCIVFNKLTFSNVFVYFQGFEYSRSGNPTRNCLEKAVAALDGAKYCK